ncbi:energy transducer TonB [Fusobacterium sp.]|uniref:energy transducer TonB n=1 Tax=Fusobacterium sp. TaxID=68766 RepID=UPI00262A922C|nr:energy transducer TonB [Fusobacterium sp.]
MKYIVISLLIHLAIFIPFHSKMNTLGDVYVHKKLSIPISYNVKNKIEKVDSTKAIPESRPEVKESEPVKEVEKKVVKKEENFESKMQSNKKKPKEKESPKKNNDSKKKKSDQKDDKPKQEQKSNPFENENFMINSDGTYTALTTQGIPFEILRQFDPKYPKQAENIRYRKVVTVKVRFLVDLNGQVQDIKILQSHAKLGFDKEVLDSLKRWKFKPIFYKGKNIKVYFIKEFIFEPK